jgi:hypothetical protein
MQHAETKKWGFNVVANTVEQHKPPSGFQTPFPSSTTQALNAKAASSFKMSQNYLPSNTLNNSDFPQHCHENIRYGKCWPVDKIN